MEVDPVYVPVPPYELMEGVTSAVAVELPDLGYAAAAIDSFATFRKLIEDGVIAPDVRFQFGSCLSTTLRLWGCMFSICSE